MRYTKDHKRRTRARLVETASRRFRSKGASGIGIARLMRELKLTHGGFYRHFGSKEELLAEAIERSGEEVAERVSKVLSQAKPGSELQAIIENYLSVQHCEDPADGCPAATLAPEVARHSRPVRLKFQDILLRQRARMLPFIKGANEQEKSRNLIVLFSGMAGAMAFARAVADDSVRDRILASAREYYIGAFCP